MPINAKDIVIIPASGSIEFKTTTNGVSQASSFNIGNDGGISIQVPQGTSFNVESEGVKVLEISSGSLNPGNPLPVTTVGVTPPLTASIGSLWFNSNDGNTYLYYSTSTWVPTTTIPGDSITITTSSNVLIDLGSY